MYQFHCKGDKDNDPSVGAAVTISVLVTFVITLVSTLLISVFITRKCYGFQFKTKKICDREGRDNVDDHNSEPAQVKQNEAENMDYEGYIIPQRNASDDCGQIYDTIH